MSTIDQLNLCAIRLETRCTIDPGCGDIAANLLETLDNGRYDRCSVLPLPASVDKWRSHHRTARKRILRADRLGYQAGVVQRHERADDIHAINTSMPERQGRPMSAGYHERPSETPLPDYPCGRHAIRTYGVTDTTGTLVAYLWLYRAGELALVSSILGHADHLDNGIMYLLFAGMLEHEIPHGPGTVVYNRHDSGTDGLRFYKERCGLTEQRVAWCL